MFYLHCVIGTFGVGNACKTISTACHTFDACAHYFLKPIQNIEYLKYQMNYTLLLCIVTMSECCCVYKYKRMHEWLQWIQIEDTAQGIHEHLHLWGGGGGHPTQPRI